MSDAFGRLHRDVQRKLHDMQWTSLNAVQVDAIEHLLGPAPCDCVIAAPTAGGKTEAAFLPVLSSIAEDAGGGVRAMYIGPLKALINDQFRRIEDLCARMEMPVHRWHGDVSQTHRKALLSNPGGVLLITPESLEAMFILRATQMPRLFGRLAYVVVDEMHAFLGSVRGAQLISQLHRLRVRTGADPLRIGLSATLGDPQAAGRWLRPDARPVRHIAQSTGGSEIAIKVRGFWKPAPSPEGDDDERTALVELAQAVLLAGRGKTNLVFANTKQLIEVVAEELTTQAAVLELPDEIVVHHGSLSKELRESAEARLRDDRPCTAVCSNTLEMGIDIGSIDEIVQVSAPWSVASLVQRLGRSGRRPGSKRILRGYFIEERADERGFWQQLHPAFIRAVAAIELLLERFVESPRSDRAELSTLVQQVLSCAAETGGARAADMFERTVGSGAFHGVTRADFVELLRELGSRELLEQMPDGTLVLGVKGLPIVDHYTFYAAFRASVEYQVFHGSRNLGRLQEDCLPPPGEHVILSGRRWQVEEIVVERKQVYVIPSRGRRPPGFISGGADLDTRIHARMRQLLESATAPAYLDATANEILNASRAAVRHMDLGRRVHPMANGCRLMLWAGTRAHRTLDLALRAAEVEVEWSTDLGIDAKASSEAVATALRALMGAPDANHLAAFADEHQAARAVHGDKFDEFVPAHLWQRVYANERLDLPSAKVLAEEIVTELEAT